MKRVKFFVLMLIAIVSLTLYTSCNKANPDTTAAYNFELVTLEGQKITLDDFKGKVLLLDFWDTWCPPCKAEIPHFVELYSKYNAEGFEILGVAFGRDGQEVVNNFLQDYNVNYINALANRDIVNGYGGITSIPTTFLIDKKGNIIKKYVGYNDKSVFENDIKTIL